MTTGAARTARRTKGSAALPSEFYARDTELVARDLLGCVLECRTPDGIVSGRIVETEAYIGEHDLACHAAAGRTRRTEPLYGPAGTSYVYFIYGVHWCFNAVTRESGHPSAVLVRALEPLEGLTIARSRRRAAKRDVDLMNGPGKLCEALGIHAAHNALPLDRPPVRILPGNTVAAADVTITPRIGISESKEWPLRYYITASPFVSRTPKSFPRWRADR